MPSAHQFLFRMNFGSQESVALFNVSTLLFDLNRIYVSGCSEVDREIARKSPQNRNRYRVAEGLELRVARIRFELPLLLDLINQVGPNSAGVAAIGAGVWALAQALEKLVLLGPTRRQAIANARKTELEVAQAETVNSQRITESASRLRVQVAGMRNELDTLTPRIARRIEDSPDIQNALQRLRQNPLHPVSIDIRPQQAPPKR